ncbi:MAG TPA: SpoIID/LytB domain-containing protein [Gemmatimonadaceae bacterium]|nr:SpoIID/LytB domain-containing protein [Gemmatimonadaceae bacterium]
MRLAPRAPLVALVIAACTLPPSPPRPAVERSRAQERSGEIARRRRDAGPTVRVALLTGVPTARLSGTGSWRVYDGDRPGTVLVRGGPDVPWTAEARDGRVRLRRADGTPTEWRDEPLLVRALGEAHYLAVNGKRYRGELLLVPRRAGLLVVNRLPMEAYLRGVVPLEIGPDRLASERAAAEAQAVAARSYTYVKMREGARAPYDLRASVLDQVYGGVGAERRVSDAAVETTAGLVLRYRGRIVTAPYHSACGGATAEPPEVWRASAEPYLRSVSDRVPGSDRYYCERAPRFRWTRSWDARALDTLVSRYVRRVGGASAGGHVRRVRVDGRTPSGRAAALVVETDGGTVRLRGNTMREVFRSASGEMLNSTYVSVRGLTDGDGPLRRLTIEGSGYGHGIGMCQWGAIGRARAGHDFRAILAAYYPGATVAAAG